MDQPIQLTPEEEQLLDVAMAIADGARVDWSSAVSSSTPLSDSAPVVSLAAKLQHLERIARGHQALLSSHGRDYDDQNADETLLTRRRRAVAAQGGAEAIQVVWGSLVVLDKVGRGSFGDVYRAWDPRLDREVALKLLRDRAGDKAPAVQEGRLLARVRHPNVITVYGAERVDGRVGIWMEYVRGRTLAAELEDCGPMSAPDAARVGIEVCKALGAVHAAGLLHRDVKAHNVMRDEAGRIVLGDFGTGVSIDEEVVRGEPSMAGTPLYIAPEVLEHLPPTERSDVYSVGVLLYFLVSGKYPVNGKSFREIRRAHAAGARVPLLQARPDLPNAFVAVVEGLLDASPDRRCGSAESAETALAHWLQSIETATIAPTDRLATSGVRSSVFWALAAAAAVATVVIIETVGERSGPLTRQPDRQLAMAGGPTTRHIVNAPCSGAPSADGLWIACVESVTHALARGQQLPPPLVLFSVATGEFRVLRSATPAERITGAVISPDGQNVAFATISADGRPAFGVVEAATGTGSPVVALSNLRAIGLTAWSRQDDRIEARVIHNDGTQGFALVSPSAATVDEVFAFSAPPQGFARSRDGVWLAFDARQIETAPERDLRLCELASGQCATVAAHAANEFSPMFTPSGRLLFNSDRSGTMALWAVDVVGLRETSVPELVRDTGRSRVAPLGFTDSGTLYYDLWVDGFNVQAADLDAAAGVVSTPLRLSRRGVDFHKSATWSGDGTLVAYVSQRGPFAEPGSVAIILQSTATGEEREFRYDFTFNMTRIAFSPDGRTLAVRGLRRDMENVAFGIHLVDVTTGQIRRTLTRRNPPEQFVEDQIGDIAWQDGTTVIFSSAGGVGALDVSGERDRRIWNAPTGETVEGLALSLDGRLAAVTLSMPAGSRIVVVPLDGSAEAGELLRTVRSEMPMAESWTADGRAVLLTRFAGAPGLRQLWIAPLDGTGAAPVPLTLAGLSEVRMHPAGTRIAFTTGALRPELSSMSGLSR